MLSGSWSLSELKDRCQHTSLVGVLDELWGVMVTVLRGVVCTGLKDAFSKLETWCMQGVSLKELVNQQCQNHSHNLHLLMIAVG